jgi:hypothetical protein
VTLVLLGTAVTVALDELNTLAVFMVAELAGVEIMFVTKFSKVSDIVLEVTLVIPV